MPNPTLRRLDTLMRLSSLKRMPKENISRLISVLKALSFISRANEAPSIYPFLTSDPYPSEVPTFKPILPINGIDI